MPIDEGVAENQITGYDNNDPKQVNERKAASGRKQDRIRAAYRALLSHHQGRELLWDLLSTCGNHKISYHPASKDLAMEMAFAEGQRNVGLQLERVLIKSDSKLYALMVQENSND